MSRRAPIPPMTAMVPRRELEALQAKVKGLEEQLKGAVEANRAQLQRLVQQDAELRHLRTGGKTERQEERVMCPECGGARVVRDLGPRGALIVACGTCGGEGTVERGR